MAARPGSSRAEWPLYPVEHSFHSRALPHENLPVPGMASAESTTGWSWATGPYGVSNLTLQPAYGTFYDSSPNGAFGGGPGGGAGVMQFPSAIAAMIRLDPSRAAEATPGMAPTLKFAANPTMDYRQPPTLGDLSYKIPAGP